MEYSFMAECRPITVMAGCRAASAGAGSRQPRKEL